MIKVIMGPQGSGKTRVLVDTVNDALNNEKGSVVCIGRDKRFVYDLKPEVRLVEISHFKILDLDMMLGFLCGIISQNFDISHIFIDSILKIAPGKIEELDAFFEELDVISEKFEVDFTITLSEDQSKATSKIKSYL